MQFYLQVAHTVGLGYHWGLPEWGMRSQVQRRAHRFLYKTDIGGWICKLAAASEQQHPEPCRGPGGPLLLLGCPAQALGSGMLPAAVEVGQPFATLKNSGPCILGSGAGRGSPSLMEASRTLEAEMARGCTAWAG